MMGLKCLNKGHNEDYLKILSSMFVADQRPVLEYSFYIDDDAG